MTRPERARIVGKYIVLYQAPLSVAERLKNRYEKFRAHGHFTEKAENSGDMKSTKSVPALVTA